MPSPYYHQSIQQQRHYAYRFPISHVPAPLVVYDQAIPVHYTMPVFYPSQSMQYVDEVAILNQERPIHSYRQNQNPYYPTHIHQQFEAFLEERLILHELEAADPALQRAGTSGSGLSEEDISNNLHVYTIKGKTSELHTCSICLCDCEINEKIGRLECGHRYHAGCIKPWLLSNNACPMCRATALRIA